MQNNPIPFLTIFTPTYNRANTLRRTYESLCMQSLMDFEWLIVDDGSDDNTPELVAGWMAKNNDFNIRYIKKKNEGFHTGYNIAIENMKSILAMCVDSDDYLPNNAVELIYRCWGGRKQLEVGGIIGLDFSIDGNVIGGYMPNIDTINLIDLALGKIPIRRGDKKIVVRTDLYKAVAPMKVFPGEKFFNPHYMHLEISRKYDFLVLNECLCIVDYQKNGLSANMFRQYKNSPNSFLELRKQRFSFKGISLKDLLRNGIHFVSSAILSKRFIEEFLLCKFKGILIICFLPGLILSIITKLRG